MEPTTTTKIMSAKPADSQPNGLVPGVAHLAIDVVERTQTTAIGLVQDARGELRLVVDGALDLAEKATTSLFRLARKLTSRFDEAVAETVASSERMMGSMMRGARDTTRSANELANTAIDGVVGSRKPSTLS